MGIYDRHYIREAPPPHGAYGRSPLSGMRRWSANTWLILICIGVFVIDGFLRERDVPTGHFSSEQLYAIDPDLLYIGPHLVWRAVRLHTGEEVPGWWRSVHEQKTDQQVGWAHVYRMRFLESYLHFSTRLGFLWPHIQYWRFLGFQFLHANVAHLMFNMLALYFFGGFVERYLGSKRYLAFYLLCGVFGALVYLVLNLGGYLLSDILRFDVRVPGLLFNDPSTPLVGASAGIFGVLMAGAFLAPNAIVLLFFFFPMPLRTLAYVLVIIAFITVLVGGHNAGGEAGHLGGAMAGFYFIRHPHHLHGFFDILGRVDPTSHHYRDKWRGSMEIRHSRSNQAEVDRILAKIHADGLHSLTDAEKRTLREASNPDQ